MVEAGMRAGSKYQQVSTVAGLTEGIRPNAFPKPVSNEPKLDVVYAVDERICLLCHLVVHRFGKVDRSHRTKRVKCLFILGRNEETARRDREHNMRILANEAIGHDYRTVRG